MFMLAKKQKDSLENDSLIEDEDFDEFIYQPTPLSSHLKDSLKVLYSNKISPIKKNFFKKLLFQLSMLTYLKVSHVATFKKLKKIDDLIKLQTNNFSLANLEKSFLEVQNLLIDNNLSLSIFYLRNKTKIESNFIHAPFTFEEQSKLFLKMIQSDSSYIEKFKKQFGYYSMNNYELASRRFSEYSKTEILKLSKLTANLPMRIKKTDLDVLEQFVYNPVSDKEIYGNILVIRDMAKDISIRIIALLRRRVLEIANLHRIAEPFQCRWEELLEKENQK